MGNNPGYQLLSPWERLGEGVWPQGIYKKTFSAHHASLGFLQKTPGYLIGKRGMDVDL